MAIGGAIVFVSTKVKKTKKTIYFKPFISKRGYKDLCLHIYTNIGPLSL